MTDEELQFIMNVTSIAFERWTFLPLFPGIWGEMVADASAPRVWRRDQIAGSSIH